MFAFLHLVVWLTRNREIQNIVDEDSTEFACSHFGIKGESFEKVVLILSSTEHVFPWNKYFDHLKNFILLITDSVSMQPIYFFLFFFFFFSRKKKTPTERRLRSSEFLTKLAFMFFLNALFSFLSSSCKWKLFKNETSQFSSVPLKIFGGWLFLLFKKFKQNEKINVNLHFHPSYWCLEKFYGSRISFH